MKRLAAAVVLVLLGALLGLKTRRRGPVPSNVMLPMPDASRRPGAPGGRVSAPDFRAIDPPRKPLEAAPSLPAPAVPAAAAKDSVSVLDEILRSRDDNDPRLDADFNGLSVETRRRFREKYRAIPPEGRNQRGTIVYLLGKNLHVPEDWAFLREVAGEPPCLSLSDCARAPSAGEDGSEDSGASVTLAYPALVALKQAERVLAEGPASARREAQSVVRAGKGSRASVVIEAAARLESRF